jgi:hypothetical protein
LAEPFENRSQHLIFGALHRHPVEMVTIDFELYSLLHDRDQSGAGTRVSLNQLVFAAAEKASAIGNDKAGREFAAGFAFPCKFNIRTADAVTVNVLVAFGTG